jgi:sulfur carrier protein
MKVELRNPTRVHEFDEAMSVVKLLNRLKLDRGSVLVISNGTLVPNDAFLAADADVEIRNVISGGAGVISGGAYVISGGAE